MHSVRYTLVRVGKSQNSTPSLSTPAFSTPAMSILLQCPPPVFIYSVNGHSCIFSPLTLQSLKACKLVYTQSNTSKMRVALSIHNLQHILKIIRSVTNPRTSATGSALEHNEQLSNAGPECNKGMNLDYVYGQSIYS